jgi:hypothetical protein
MIHVKKVANNQKVKTQKNIYLFIRVFFFLIKKKLNK